MKVMDRDWNVIFFMCVVHDDVSSVRQMGGDLEGVRFHWIQHFKARNT